MEEDVTDIGRQIVDAVTTDMDYEILASELQSQSPINIPKLASSMRTVVDAVKNADDNGPATAALEYMMHTMVGLAHKVERLEARGTHPAPGSGRIYAQNWGDQSFAFVKSIVSDGLYILPVVAKFETDFGRAFNAARPLIPATRKLVQSVREALYRLLEKIGDIDIRCYMVKTERKHRGLIVLPDDWVEKFCTYFMAVVDVDWIRGDCASNSTSQRDSYAAGLLNDLRQSLPAMLRDELNTIRRVFAELAKEGKPPSFVHRNYRFRYTKNCEEGDELDDPSMIPEDQVASIEDQETTTSQEQTVGAEEARSSEQNSDLNRSALSLTADPPDTTLADKLKARGASDKHCSLFATSTTSSANDDVASNVLPAEKDLNDLEDHVSAKRARPDEQPPRPVTTYAHFSADSLKIAALKKRSSEPTSPSASPSSTHPSRRSRRATIKVSSGVTLEPPTDRKPAPHSHQPSLPEQTRKT